MSSTMPLHQAITHTLSYFGQFTYAPSLREIHQFLPKKATLADVEKAIQNGVKSGKYIEFSFLSSIHRYTLPQYSISKKTVLKRLKTTERKEQMLGRWLFILKHVPGIRLVGLSGSVASYNARPEDDIDLFIICSRGTLWTVRAVVTVLFMLFGVRRQRLHTSAPNKLCFNLWFEESALEVPKSKQSEYTAYEVWRMRPMYSNNHIHESFMYANRWTTHFFPNAPTIHKPPGHRMHSETFPLLVVLEQCMKKMQLTLIKRHQTTELITDFQLWFYPDDMFEQIRKNTKKAPMVRSARKK